MVQWHMGHSLHRFIFLRLELLVLCSHILSQRQEVLSSCFCTSEVWRAWDRLNYVQFNMYRGLVKDYWKNGSELNHFSREKLFYSYKVQWVLVMSVLVIGQGDICSGMKFGILAWAGEWWVDVDQFIHTCRGIMTSARKLPFCLFVLFCFDVNCF